MSERKLSLEPLAAGASGGLLSLVVLAVVGVVLVVSGSGSVFGLGGGTACAVDPGLAVGGVLAERAAPGVSTTATEVQFCTSDPNGAQMMWQALTALPGFVLAAGVLVLVWRLIRVAGSRGAYTPDVVRGLRALAWCLLAGAVLAPIVQDIANAQLLRTLSADYSYTFQLPDISLAAVLTGLGLIALTRVMRNAVRMREDLEGLV
ncbi:DUF2975 domain-containing protein [Streptosporangium saharense]|uniref:DUF2975 domain-containing protein n=1 Tax=Streptosporangium saharense TaxID=1706840 RepID=A0A7W7QQ13_9ACTN|nr:DUF2975 domain-containing protein [Streptosporangium saharense]MBB4917568.1 hypothetical protein [Streptosporangium saharense]